MNTRAATRGRRQRDRGADWYGRGVTTSDPQEAAPRSPSLSRSPSLKRGLDLASALFLLAAVAPLMAVIAVAVRLTGDGPIFYRQARVGRGGRVFEMLKFRSMPVDAEEPTGPVWSRRGDRRPTRVGRVLRRFGLDELPQLINVVLGEMSLVGPRPERPVFVRRFALEFIDYEKRHSVRPGITGWAQVCGWRGDTSLSERLRYDLEYLRRRSIWFDIYIALRTPAAIIRGEQ